MADNIQDPNNEGVNSPDFGKIDPLSPLAPKSDPLALYIVELAEIIKYSYLSLDEKMAGLACFAGIVASHSNSLDEYYHLMDVFDSNFTHSVKQHLKISFQ